MITTEHSLWFLPLCLVIGIAYALILYCKAKKPELSLWVKRIAFVTRALVVSTLTFLLLNPLILSVHKESERPLLIVGVDNSESMLYTKDSAYYKNDFQQQLQAVVDRLKKKYRVETMLVGDTLRYDNQLSFKDKESNLSDFFQFIQAKYINQNIGAVVFASDGIFNAGTNPFYVASELSCPIYTIAMGDTTIRKDALIAKVNYNKTVFKNNFFSLEILVQANKLANTKTKLIVSEKENTVFEKDILVKTNAFSEWVRLNLEAKESGVHAYKIELLPIDEEVTVENNKTEVFIETIDERKKIAIIYSVPHPDISAVAQSLQYNDNYQVETFSVDKFNTSVNDYDMIVLHQLPSRIHQAKQLLESIQKVGISTFYIFGKQTNYVYLNGLNLGVQLQLTRELFNDAYPLYNQSFTAFTTSSILPDFIKEMPPIPVPFANYKLSPSVNVLFYQTIGSVQTTYPLMFYNQTENQKIAVFLGEGLWRWRNYNYMLEQNHEIFNEILSKTVQFLLVKEDKSLFRVTTNTIFNENEAVIFNAELYNQNYELINEPAISLQIKSKENAFAYTFSRTFSSYHLDAGRLPVGAYQWHAVVEYGNQKYSKSGYFNIKKLNIEAANLVADHQLMKNIANINHGKMYTPYQLENIEKDIKNNKEIVSVARFIKKQNSLLNSFLILSILLLLLSVEWFFRKWSGGY